MRAWSGAIASLLMLALPSTRAVASSPVFLVKNINTEAGSAQPNLVPFARRTDAFDRGANGKVFFVGRTTMSGDELWISDGTAEGTNLAAEIAPGLDCSSPRSLTIMAGNVYFSASESYWGIRQLWMSDGSVAGTIRLTNLPQSQSIPDTESFLVAGSNLFFPAGNRIWRTNGTLAGTFEVGSASEVWEPSQAAALGSTVYFSSYESIGGRELYQFDGTASGFKFVKDIFPGSASGITGGLTTMGQAFYFAGNDGTRGFELWKSDGTAAGTALLKDIAPGSYGSTPTAFTVVGSTLYFQANDGIHGNELWKTDGTAAGTVLVKDIVPGAGDSYLYLLTAVSGTLYFVDFSFAAGVGLWRSDGTAAGTVRVSDIPGDTNSIPEHLTAVGDTLYFEAGPDEYQRRLWRSDGTQAGTRPVAANGSAEPSGSFASGFAVDAGTLYFSAYDGVHIGEVLWKSDGSDAGTRMVASATSGSQSSWPLNFAVLNGALYFTVEVPMGHQLWKSDGAEAGTLLVKDLQDENWDSTRRQRHDGGESPLLRAQLPVWRP